MERVCIYVVVVVKEEGGDQSGDDVSSFMRQVLFDLLLILNTYINYFLL